MTETARLFAAPMQAFKSPGRKFRLLSNPEACWTLPTRTPIRIGLADTIAVDLALEGLPVSSLPAGLRHLSLDESWLRQWLPRPEVLLRRRIPFQSTHGAALGAILKLQAADPDLSVTSLPPVIVDQLGILLAVSAQEALAELAITPTGQRPLHERLHALIALRCTDRRLTATHVANELGISTRTLHRTLASTQESFAERLLAARAKVAHDLLKSASARRLSIAEIGRRAGFSEPSNFARAMRSKFDALPSQIRDSAVRRSDRQDGSSLRPETRTKP